MVKNILLKTQEMLHQRSKKPWASFNYGFESDDRIKVDFRWNTAFIKKITELGFHAETEEDSVMLFYYASQMNQSDISGDDVVQSDAHPSLTSPDHILRT